VVKWGRRGGGGGKHEGRTSVNKDISPTIFGEGESSMNPLVERDFGVGYQFFTGGHRGVVLKNQFVVLRVPVVHVKSKSIVLAVGLTS
jgi:hypothetical protein